MTTHLFDDDGRYWRGGDVLVKYKCTRTIKPSSSRSIEYLREPELCIYIILLYVRTRIQIIIIEEVLNPPNYSGKGVRPAIYIVDGNPTRGTAIVLNAVMHTLTYYPQSRSRKSVSIILSTHYKDV